MACVELVNAHSASLSLSAFAPLPFFQDLLFYSKVDALLLSISHHLTHEPERRTRTFPIFPTWRWAGDSIEHDLTLEDGAGWGEAYTG